MAESGAWLLVLSSVFLCNALKILLPSCSSIISRLLQKDAEQESEMRAEIQNMKQELSTISMMDEFARYARLERKINKMTDKLKTHVKARTAQLAKIKWVINIVFYILQAALMISLIWKYYSEPVTVLPSKWLAPLERLVAFPTGVAGPAPSWLPSLEERHLYIQRCFVPVYLVTLKFHGFLHFQSFLQRHVCIRVIDAMI
ncbi:guided entry of tail-anchored proteins factor 1 isoform X1 [Patagioenas fasciata]|uniref:guided entry of tail-anchored proteins factor 1 isoform X1 n=1 Tax=Patagioenas fasciata TaxID=372321 RepID=UPI003A9A06AA